jgi:dTDP-4-amino-4,6-dideoxygalactose transaminase
VTLAASRRTPALLGGEPCFAEPVYVTRARVPDRATFAELVDSVFRARWFTNDGALVRQLEDRLRRWLGVPFCAVFCNGTTALQVALRSLDLSGEVITTPFTFPATIHAIQWNGLTPVFCDVDPETYNLDPHLAASLVTERTAALVPVHVFGNPCDVVALERLAATHGIRVVYDAAHALGVSCLDRPIGCWATCRSSASRDQALPHGRGGALVGLTPAARGARPLRNFGIVNEEEVQGVA